MLQFRMKLGIELDTFLCKHTTSWKYVSELYLEEDDLKAVFHTRPNDCLVLSIDEGENATPLLMLNNDEDYNFILEKGYQYDAVIDEIQKVLGEYEIPVQPLGKHEFIQYCSQFG